MKSLYAFFLIILLPRVYAITPVPTPTIPAQKQPVVKTFDLKAYVVAQSEKYGVNPVDSLFILQHESQDCKNLVGDDGNSRGCWMISSIWHPEVSKTCAMNIQCSTNWALNQMAHDGMNQWTTWKYRCKWYSNENPPDCP